MRALPSAPPALVVSLHDVSPLTWERSRSILEDLAKVAPQAKLSLLVVPNHHHRAPLDSQGPFSAWLGGQVEAGHEPVLHGYFHQRSSAAKESMFTRLITAHYTAGEGEFFDLGFGEAVERLRRGKREVEACCAARVEGFIAPAWLLGKEAARAVGQEGFAYTTRLDKVERFEMPPVTHRSQSLVWSVRAAWRRLASLAWNHTLFHALSKNSLLRIGIHPPDWDFPLVRAQILALVRRALASRTPCTYLSFVRNFLQ